MSISAIVLAAGLSRRMGAFKQLLPWQGSTVLAHVVTTLAAAGIPDVVVVAGYRFGDVSRAIAGLSGARLVHNPEYEQGMLSSIRAGLGALLEGPANVPAALLCLGDQPQAQVATVHAVLASGAEHAWARIVIPSYQMRAGHPILLPRWLWPEILACRESMRAVLGVLRAETVFVPVDSATILADLDTPADYEKAGYYGGDGEPSARPGG